MADTQWLTQAQYDLLAYELKERIEVKRVEDRTPDRCQPRPGRRPAREPAATTPRATSSP